MIIKHLIWLDEIIEKLITKHNVSKVEVMEILSNKPYFRFVEKGYTKGEDVYSALGKTDNGRALIVFFIYKSDKRILIISAREMTKNEKKLYEKK